MEFYSAIIKKKGNDDLHNKIYLGLEIVVK